MASIKIKTPYTYQAYKFSTKATKYSQKIAIWKITGKTFSIWMVTYFVMLSTFALLTMENFWSSDANVLSMLAVFAVSIYIAIQLKKLILAVYTEKLILELKEQAKSADTANPMLAALIRQRLIPEAERSAKA